MVDLSMHLMDIVQNSIRAEAKNIRVDFLEKVVLGEIRRLTKLATQYESEFAKIVMGNSIKTAEQERRSKQKELNSLLARDKELDLLFEKIYEDNTLGRISDDRFSKLSVKYETEQKENEVKIFLSLHLVLNSSLNINLDLESGSHLINSQSHNYGEF